MAKNAFKHGEEVLVVISNPVGLFSNTAPFMLPGIIVVHPDGPVKHLKRGKKFFVITSDSGYWPARGNGGYYWEHDIFLCTDEGKAAALRCMAKKTLGKKRHLRKELRDVTARIDGDLQELDQQAAKLEQTALNWEVFGQASDPNKVKVTES